MGGASGNDGAVRDGSSGRIWSRAFVSIFIANGALAMGQQMVNVLIALYADSLGASTTLVGFAVSAFAYTALALKVLSAPAIDAFSRKKILVAALLAVAASYFVFSVSSNIAVVILARLLQGAAMAFTFTCCLAMATDTLPRDRVNSGIGYFSLAQAACMAVGPMVGLTLADALGYNAAFGIAGVIMLCAVGCALMVKEPPHKRRPFKITPSSVFAFEAAVPALIAGLLVIAFCNVNSFLALYAAERGVDNIGLFFTVNALLMLLSRPLTGRLADKYGLVKVALPAMVSFALSFVVISQADALWMFLAAAVLSAFGYGAAGPLLQACCMECVPPERRGAAGSAYFIGIDAGNIIGPVLAGSVAEVTGYQPMWLILLVFIAAAFALTVAFRKKIARIESDFARAGADGAEGEADADGAAGKGGDAGKGGVA